MAEVAAHLVDRVLPKAAYRQWTLSVPHERGLPMLAEAIKRRGLPAQGRSPAAWLAILLLAHSVQIWLKFAIVGPAAGPDDARPDSGFCDHAVLIHY